MNVGLQRKSLRMLAGVERTDLVVIASPLSGRKQERARRKCLETLLPILEGRYIEDLVLESRKPVADKLDINYVKYARGTKLVKTINVTHEALCYPVNCKTEQRSNMTESKPIVAWGDESARMRHKPPIYLLCASVFEEGSEEGLRELAQTKPAGMRKLHWHDMDVKEKVRSLEVISRIPHWNMVAICSPMPIGPRQERARRKCFERLLPQLEERGVELLTLESRWKQEDQSDVDMIHALRNRK